MQVFHQPLHKAAGRPGLGFSIVGGSDCPGGALGIFVRCDTIAPLPTRTGQDASHHHHPLQDSVSWRSSSVGAATRDQRRLLEGIYRMRRRKRSWKEDSRPRPLFLFFSVCFPLLPLSPLYLFRDFRPCIIVISHQCHIQIANTIINSPTPPPPTSTLSHLHICIQLISNSINPNMNTQI